MKHPFYQKTEKQQKALQLKLSLLALLFIGLTGWLSWLSGFYLLVALAIPLSLSIIAPFLDVPALYKKGDLHYFSPLFLAEKPKNGTITVHGGTLLDYAFVIDRTKNGSQRTAFILEQYTEGLLNLIETYQDQPELLIRGTSYIINPRTAERLGFRRSKTDPIQKLILIYNYCNIMLCYSMAKGKWGFPRYGTIYTFEATLSQLKDRREFILSLNHKLTEKQQAERSGKEPSF